MSFCIFMYFDDGSKRLISRHKSEERARAVLEWYGFSNCEIEQMEVEDDKQD